MCRGFEANFISGGLRTEKWTKEKKRKGSTEAVFLVVSDPSMNEL
jgi:hypothetical protein